MPPSTNNNSKLPGSSSSISLNESPNEEINYDSDISEDDHAIAEGDDDEYDDEEEEGEDGDPEDDEEPDEGFAVEVNTLTGNTFNIMIHPSDTVEVLKTRIAFQEGISPADQNLLLDSTTGCSNNATVQDLNIDRNSKLTLVTNVASGVPFKTPTTTTISDSNVELMGGGGGDPPSYKLAPTIKRNYNNNINNNNHSISNNQQKHSSSSSSSSLRLPKILTTSTYLDKNSNVVGSTMHRNGHVESQQECKEELLHHHHQRPRLDEREWMKSLFNKVVQQNEEEEDTGQQQCNNDEFCNSRAKIIIDIDSTNNAACSPTTTTIIPPNGHGPRVSTRYVGTKYAPEEDGSILVVQGDDGVILIIQKNTGQLLEESVSGGNNNRNGNSRYYNHKNNRFGEVDVETGRSGELMNGRVGRLGRHTKNNSSNYNTETSVNSSMSSSYRRSRYQEESKLVHDKIKENAVTLEKMRQVRSMMAQQKRDRSGTRGDDDYEEIIGSAEDRGKGEEAVIEKSRRGLEFPKILDGGGSRLLGMKNGGGAVGYRSNGVGVGGTRRRSAAGAGRSLRSINSSKMSLNRLIAEIYLQTKRKDRHGFQPGQPPYTEQQLLRYVQLKTAILLDEQKRNRTEPCSKCQLDEDWSFNEAAPYLIPTVVMNRFKRLANGRNSKSLDKEEIDDEDYDTSKATTLRRKSMIPVLSSSRPSITKLFHNNQRQRTTVNNDASSGGGGSYIPRLILVNRDHETESGANRNNPTSVATTASNISRRSSSSLTKMNGAYPRFSSGSSGGRNNEGSYYAMRENDDEQVDEDEGICDTIIITSSGLGNRGTGARPTYKVYPKMYSTSIGYGGRSSTSRPGSSGKASAAKKGSVRCQFCKKKVGISCRYQCRCGLTFCSVHRYPEAHECTFDYKTEGRNKLRESNPVIVAPKIQEI